MTQTNNKWQPVSRIQVVQSIIAEKLEVAQRTMEALNKMSSSEKVSVADCYRMENKDIPHALAQCHRWKGEVLNEKQIEWVNAIEHDLKAYEKVINEMLHLTQDD